jgi:hypothetical protein
MKSNICKALIASAALLGAMPSVVQAQFAIGMPLRPGMKVTDSPVLAGSGAVPRHANGHPDLTGMWNGLPDGRDPGGDNTPDTENPGLAVFPARKGDISYAEQDNRLIAASTDDIPQYKPQYWAKVNELDQNSYKADPAFGCATPGVPRMGAPVKIVQEQNEVILFNTFILAANWFRIIPTTGRDHRPVDLLVGSYYGDGVGKWEGDTLVVDSLGFNDITWLNRGGMFHTADLRVVERLTRYAYNRLLYEVTVEDPELLTEPWVRRKVLFLNLNPDANIFELPPCSERDADHIILNLR